MKNKVQECTNNVVIIFILTIILHSFICNSLCRAEVADRVVAVVNDDVISLNDLTEATKNYVEKIKSLNNSPEEEREMLFKLREDALNELINQKLTDQEIKKYELSVNDKEVDSAIERIKEAKYLTDEELRRAVAKEGLTFDAFRKVLKDNILRSKIVDIEVKSKIIITKNDIKAYYESHKSDYMEKKKYHLFNIIKKVDILADEDDKHEAMSIMEKVYGKLMEKRKPEEVVKDYAESSGIESSDLGIFRFDELSQQIQDAIKGLKQNEFSKVLETDLGYQIIYIKEIEVKSGKSLDEANSEIQGILFNDVVNKKFKLWMEQLKKKSYIKIIK